MRFLLRSRLSRVGRLARKLRNRAVFCGVEPLEVRSLLSVASGTDALIDHVPRWHDAARNLPHTPISPTASRAARHSGGSLQVKGSYPHSGQTLDKAVAAFTVYFNQLPKGTTLNSGDVQLSHQNANGSWQVLPTTSLVNPGNNSIEIVPLVNQPNGLYKVGIYPGVRGVGGGTLARAVFETYTVADPWGSQNPVTVFPSNNGETGVVVADQSRALDPSSVNNSTVQVHALNADGSLGASVPVTVVYDPNIPSIELAIQVGLSAGTYQFLEQGVRDAAGDVLTTPYTQNFTIAQTQVPPGPDILPGATIAVAGSYPVDGSTTETTPIASVYFNEAADPTTVNTSTVQLVRWVPSLGGWSNPLPISVTYSNLHKATIIPTAGLEEGSYLIAVNGVKDLLGQSMAGPQYFHYKFYSATAPPLNGDLFGSYPALGQTIQGVPPAILVFLRKYAGEQPWSVNTNTVQLLPWVGNHAGNPLPISVAYSLGPGTIVISPNFPIGDGKYVVEVNGLVDLAGNVQRNSFQSWFVIKGTGRRQST